MYSKRRKSKHIMALDLVTGILCGLSLTYIGGLLLAVTESLLFRLFSFLPEQARFQTLLNQLNQQLAFQNKHFLFLFSFTTFMILIIAFLILLIIRLRKQHYGSLFQCSLWSLIFPILFACLTGFGHSLLQCILIPFPGLIAFLVFLLCFKAAVRSHDDEYKMPRKQNYYYI